MQSHEDLILRPVGRHARQFPDRLALIQNEAPLFSYRQLEEFLRQSAAWWQAHTARTLLYLPHGAGKAAQILTLLSHGVPGLAISVRTPAREILRLAREFSATQILTTRFLAQKIFADASEFLAAPQTPCHAINEIGLIRLSTASPPKSAPWHLVTSGSSGAPKAVLLSLANLIERTRGEIALLEITPGRRIVNALSFAHDLGFNQLLTAVHAGATLQVLSAPLPADLWHVLDSGQTHAITGTPLLWTSLIQLGVGPNQHPGYLTVSGGSFSPVQLEKLRQVFPQARIVKTYGQTETFRTFSETHQGRVLGDSAGHTVPGVTAVIVDDELKTCAVGEVGQILHFGAGGFDGYLDDLELSQTKWVHGNQLVPARADLGLGIRTGDYARVLPDGEVAFQGRRDDLVKRHDHRVYLSEIRQHLLRSNLALDAYVLPVQDHLIAWLQPLNGATLADIKKYIKTHLAPHQAPDEIHLVDQFPRTFSDKIDPGQLVTMGGSACV